MLEPISFKNSLGLTLPGVLHTSAKNNGHQAGVIICHGLARSKSDPLVAKIAESLSAKYIVLRPDLTGHGESQGQFTQATYTQWTDDILKAIDFLHDRGIRRLALVGHSQAAACILAAASQDNRLSALVLLAPVGYPARMKERYPADELASTLATDTATTYRRGDLELPLYKNYFTDLDQQDIMKYAQRVHWPTLIIHGSKDRAVPPAQSLDIYNNLGSDKHIIKRVMLVGADHGFNNCQPKYMNVIIRETFKWLDKFAPYEIKAVRAYVMHKGKLLIVRRSQRMNNYAGFWSTIGGIWDNAETFEEQAKIEIEEETGIGREDLTLIKSGIEPVRLEDKNADKLWVIHQVMFESMTDQVKLNWEATDYKWIKLDQLSQYKIMPGTAAELSKFSSS